MCHLYRLTLACLLMTVFACANIEQPSSERWIAVAPAGDAYCEINPDGKTIIPNGRIVEPFGQTFMVAPHPYGLTLSPDGTTAVTANSGTRPFSISIIRDVTGSPKIQQIPEGPMNDEGILESVFMGLAITPDNRFVYVGGGISNKIFKFDLENGAKVDSINCTIQDGGLDFTDGYIGDLILSTNGDRLFAVDQIGFRLIVIDTKSNEIIQNVPTGRYPFGICLSPDEQSIYVANVGVFEYKSFGHLDINNVKAGSLKFPASAYQSQEMMEGYANDSIQVPALGDPNAPEAFSVWKYNNGENISGR